MICESCRHIFFSGLQNINQADLVIYYKKTYTESHNQREIQEEAKEYYKSHLKELVDYITIDAQIRIICYGCSYPFFLIEAKNEGCDAIGIEYDDDCINFGTANGVTMISPDNYANIIPDESADIIRFSHVLEHTIDPVQTLFHVSKKLKRGGIVYITQPNFPVYKSGEGRKLKDSVYPEHLHYFNMLSLTKMIEGVDLLDVVKLFSHTNAKLVYEEDSKLIDFDKACLLKKYEKVGDNLFGEEANYPNYAGENSYLICRKCGSSNNVKNEKSGDDQYYKYKEKIGQLK